MRSRCQTADKVPATVPLPPEHGHRAILGLLGRFWALGYGMGHRVGLRGCLWRFWGCWQRLGLGLGD